MLALLSCFRLNIRSRQLLDWGCPGEVGEGGDLGWVVGTKSTPMHPCWLDGGGVAAGAPEQVDETGL